MENTIVTIEIKKVAGLGYEYAILDGMNNRMFSGAYYKTYDSASAMGFQYCNTRNYFISNLVNGQLL